MHAAGLMCVLIAKLVELLCTSHICMLSHAVVYRSLVLPQLHTDASTWQLGQMHLS